MGTTFQHHGSSGRLATTMVMVGTIALFSLSAARAEAGVITVGTWYEFGFTAAGVDATGCFPADPGGLACSPSSGTPTTFADAPPWTFVSPAGGSFMFVTDAFLYGDSFNIFNFGGLLFSTPLVPTGGGCGSDPVPCYFDPLSSSTVFFLAAGAYSFTIQPSVSPFGGGAAYFGLSPQRDVLPSSIPEPATLLLLGTGLAAAGFRRMRKRA